MSDNNGNDAASLHGEYRNKVRAFMDAMDELRTAGVEKQDDIAIPQIAVMGDQSSGKSSVLEAISGVPFPRGKGLVTKCATQVIMRTAPKGSPWSAVTSVRWADGTTEHDQQPEEAGVIASPEEVAGVIERLTQVLLKKSGHQKSFSEHSIIIKLSSPEHPNLSMVDLPGLVRTVTEDQDDRDIKTVSELITRFMKQERTIILGVIPVNADIATSSIFLPTSHLLFFMKRYTNSVSLNFLHTNYQST